MAFQGLERRQLLYLISKASKVGDNSLLPALHQIKVVTLAVFQDQDNNYIKSGVAILKRWHF